MARSSGCSPEPRSSERRGRYGLTIVSATSLMDAGFEERLKQLGASVILVEDKSRTGNQNGRLAELQRVRFSAFSIAASSAFVPCV